MRTRKTKHEKAAEEVKTLKVNLIDLAEDRDRLYKKCQDFTLGHCKTESAIQGMVKINSAMGTASNRIKKLEKEFKL